MNKTIGIIQLIISIDILSKEETRETKIDYGYENEMGFVRSWLLVAVFEVRTENLLILWILCPLSDGFDSFC
jgi:hypothetical protein